MKEYFVEFFKVLADSVLIICFAFTAFLLIINFYHFEDVKYQYDFDVINAKSYKDYKKTLASVDKKMKSVSSNGNDKYQMYGRVVLDNYNNCVSNINKSTYNNIEKNGNIINAKVVYYSNYEILNSLNNSCLFSIANFIHDSSEKAKFNHDFEKINNDITVKRNMLVDNARYLTDSGLGNSSYSFSTDIFKSTIYNKTISEFGLTMNNYNMIASILEDIADWYVLEFGGND